MTTLSMVVEIISPLLIDTFITFILCLLDRNICPYTGFIRRTYFKTFAVCHSHTPIMSMRRRIEHLLPAFSVNSLNIRNPPNAVECQICEILWIFLGRIVVRSSLLLLSLDQRTHLIPNLI
jgi:hypothetical protein